MVRLEIPDSAIRTLSDRILSTFVGGYLSDSYFALYQEPVKWTPRNLGSITFEFKMLNDYIDRFSKESHSKKTARKYE